MKQLQVNKDTFIPNFTIKNCVVVKVYLINHKLIEIEL